MSLVEALVAMAMITGVISVAIETFRIVELRTVLSEMDVQGIVLAETLLARAGNDIVLPMTQSSTIGGSRVSWTVEGRRELAAPDLQLTRIEARVSIARGGMTSSRSLATLKLSKRAE